MGSLSRKIQRKKNLKKKKKARKSLKQALHATAGMPTYCTSCGSSFKSERDSDTWVVQFESSQVTLLCEDCK